MSTLSTQSSFFEHDDGDGDDDDNGNANPYLKIKLLKANKLELENLHHKINRKEKTEKFFHAILKDLMKRKKKALFQKNMTF